MIRVRLVKDMVMTGMVLRGLGCGSTSIQWRVTGGNLSKFVPLGALHILTVQTLHYLSISFVAK